MLEVRTVNGVGNLLRRVMSEEVSLSLHRADTAVRKENPLQHLAVVICFLLCVESELLLLVVVLSEVE